MILIGKLQTAKTMVRWLAEPDDGWDIIIKDHCSIALVEAFRNKHDFPMFCLTNNWQVTLAGQCGQKRASRYTGQHSDSSGSGQN